MRHGGFEDAPDCFQDVLRCTMVENRALVRARTPFAPPRQAPPAAVCTPLGTRNRTRKSPLPGGYTPLWVTRKGCAQLPSEAARSP